VDRLLRLLRADGAVSAEEAAGWSADEWTGLVEAAAREALSPLLYDHLSRRGPHAPAAHMERLRRHYLQTAAANLRRFHELGRILMALNGADVRTAVLKGAYLAPAVYGNEALRPMVDIDLLVEERSIARALACLAALGYECELTADWMGAQLGHYALHHTETRMLLELHRRLVPTEQSEHIDHDALWARMQHVMIAGVETCALTPADLAVHLCIHAASQHLLQFGLLSLFDLEALYAHDGLRPDPAALLERASEWHATRAAYLCLRLARDLAGARVGDDVLDALSQADEDEAQVAAARTLLLSGAARGGALPSGNVIGLWAAPTWRARLAQWRHILWPDAAHLRGDLRLAPDESLRLWHYLRRWVHLATQRRRALHALLAHTEDDVRWAGLARWLAEE
jgi:hypothetical protein